MCADYFLCVLFLQVYTHDYVLTLDEIQGWRSIGSY